VKSIFLFLIILLVSTGLSAKGVDNNFNVNTTTYSDGILLMAENQNTDLQLTIAGPGNSRYTRKYSSADSVFLDINDTNGVPLSDGLYQYEVWPVPAVTYTREESSRMLDRNDIKHESGPVVSPVSGSFRVVNGEIDDPDLLEYDASVSEGAVE
jgi:hypothetical protein